jgi:transposase InsO family protein
MVDISASTRRAIVAADFFTTEVWTARGLTTFYTVFVIELHSRRVQIAGSTPHPDEAFVLQIVRHLTVADEGLLGRHRVFLCDRDRKWSLAARQLLEESGVQVIQTPFRAPNCNAHAERFVRSIKEECLDRLIPLGERHFRRALAQYMVHYNGERNHQGLGNKLIAGVRTKQACGSVGRTHRLGGLLNYYYRAA